MLVYALSENLRVVTSGGYKQTWPYRELFHGDAGGLSSKAVVNRYEHQPYEPLPLVRNIRVLPEVFFAGISLIVGERVAKELKRMPHLGLNRCQWDSVYDLPMDEESIRNLYTRFSAFTEDLTEWLRSRLTIAPSQVRRIEYFELIAPRLEKISAHFSLTTQFELPSPAYEKLPSLATSREIHVLYPVVKLTPYYIFAEAAYAAVRDYVTDSDLFGVVPIEVRD
jgi:hypothetical protein